MVDENASPTRGKGARKPRQTQRSGKDWKKARRLYEKQGKNFTEIAGILGCDRNTVARHASAEAWVDPAALLRESSVERKEKLLASFIEQDADAIRENLALKHSLNKRLLALAERHIERLEQGLELVIGTGVNAVEEDVLLSMRRIALTVQTVETVDRSIAGLKDADWRSTRGGSTEDSGSDAAAVRAALEEAEVGES